MWRATSKADLATSQAANKCHQVTQRSADRLGRPARRLARLRAGTVNINEGEPDVRSAASHKGPSSPGRSRSRTRSTNATPPTGRGPISTRLRGAFELPRHPVAARRRQIPWARRRPAAAVGGRRGMRYEPASAASASKHPTVQPRIVVHRPQESPPPAASRSSRAAPGVTRFGEPRSASPGMRPRTGSSPRPLHRPRFADQRPQ